MRILFVVYDDQGFIPDFPMGIAYLSQVLLNEGHEVEIYSQDVHHYPEEHLTEYLNKNKFDVLGIGVIGGYYQYAKLLKLSAAINRSRQKPFYVIGGHGPTPDPEYFLKITKADVVVMGEGELTMVELVDAVANHKSLAAIQGIAFREEDQVTINLRRPLIPNIDTIPFPAYHLFPMHVYRLLRLPHSSRTDFAIPILSGRGCTFTCNFCYRLDDGFRARGYDGIIEEIRLLKRDYGVTYIGFYDELLMSSLKRTVELSEALIKANLNIKWECNGRLNYAKKDVLKLMKEAGCVFINYGIEAMDDDVLKKMDKVQTVKQVIDGIENTLSSGVSPGYNMLFGNIGDTRETLKKAVDFLVKYDDGSQMRTIRPVTPYPGSPLYYHAINKGLIKDIADFYENKHTNSDLLCANFTELSDDEIYACLLEANNVLLENYYANKKAIAKTQLEDIYVRKDQTFRGFRHV